MTPTPVNPLGAKGVGEAGTLGSTPCIVAAAVDALSEFGVKHIDMMLRPEKLWRIIQGGRLVISTAFEYSRATSLDDALAKLRATNGEGKFIAGGHSLVPLMKLRLSEPKTLIDIARIPGLSGIRKNGRQDRNRRRHRPPRRGHIRVAAAGMSRCVAEAAAAIGDPQVRNRGTLGGSLAHADPAADYPAAMLALDADIHVKGPTGSRVVKAHDFFRGLFTVDLAADEIIVGVQFNPVKCAAYAKLYQRASHFAIVGVAAALDVKNGTIQSARIGLTGASSHATRLTDVEESARRKTAVHGQHRGRRAAGRRQSRGRQLRHPCKPGVSAGDDSRLHRTRAGARNGASRIAPLSIRGLSFNQLRLQTREESIEHHPRDAADQPLTDTCDRTAGVYGPAHVYCR